MLNPNINAFYFTAPWCVPCKTFGPIMGKVQARHPELNLTKIDVDDEPASASLMGVQSVPTVLLAKDGYEVARFSGARGEAFVEQFIADNFGG